MSKKNRGRRAGRVGRNDPCPCGSGEKYKRCCEASDQAQRADGSMNLERFVERWDSNVLDDVVSALNPEDARARVNDFVALLSPGGPLAELRLDPFALYEAMTSVDADTPRREWIAEVAARLVTPEVLRHFMATTSSCASDPSIRHEDRVAAGFAALSCALVDTRTSTVLSMPAIMAWLRWHIAEMGTQQHALEQQLIQLGLDVDAPSLGLERMLHNLAAPDGDK